jgi:hypothetical protein
MKTIFIYDDGSIEERDVSKSDLLALELSRHLGTRCKYCGKEYKTLEDLENTVWAGEHEHGYLACEECWNERN